MMMSKSDHNNENRLVNGVVGDGTTTATTTIRRYQGYLLKKRQLAGFQAYFVVLHRGNLIYYRKR